MYQKRGRNYQSLAWLETDLSAPFKANSIPPPELHPNSLFILSISSHLSRPQNLKTPPKTEPLHPILLKAILNEVENQRFIYSSSKHFRFD
jgi:hypothetical protein